MEPIWGEGGKIVDARVTLHGSAVASAYSDNTNHCISEIHKPEIVARILASMQYAADNEQGVIGVSQERDVEPPIRLNILYLPLSKDQQTISLFFAYVRFDPLD